jgi:hypothetical protein
MAATVIAADTTAATVMPAMDTPVAERAAIAAVAFMAVAAFTVAAVAASMAAVAASMAAVAASTVEAAATAADTGNSRSAIED